MSATVARGPGVPHVATWLGRAGLLPFLALAAAMAADEVHFALWQDLLSAYAFGILTFLLGAWWGIALVRRYPGVLVASNVAFLVLLFCYLTLSVGLFLLSAAAFFLIVLAVERRHPMFAPQPAYYARMRWQLSLVASAALVAAAALSLSAA